VAPRRKSTSASPIDLPLSLPIEQEIQFIPLKSSNNKGGATASTHIRLNFSQQMPLLRQQNLLCQV
jgi:hypothetical protein